MFITQLNELGFEERSAIAQTASQVLLPTPCVLVVVVEEPLVAIESLRANAVTSGIKPNRRALLAEANQLITKRKVV